ncbi:thiamine phosphate synthase [Listeria booriae]|uniref:thiamine phosphate synthase n=1 Tax=Listeria booriae TaxID=1552123 RepID=UPI00288036AF|nr:thiamine phosphate synthase [Listeria booriae]MDT0112294.1 thiamine phosphate synthase [Listeria booriae]
MNPNEMLAVYFIAGSQDVPENTLPEVLKDALQAGITCFQFREKKLANPEKLAKQCQKLCKQYQVPFFINDDVALALKIKADGIHVGQDDMAIQEVIATCAKKMMIGLSINTLEQGRKAAHIAELTYIGVGPIYETTSKVDAQPATGIQLIQDIRKAGITLPIVAIGGITAKDTLPIHDAGAQGVAIISAITKATNRAQVVQQFSHN